MKEETRKNIDLAITGLMFVSKTIDKALLGKDRGLNARICESEGPFALALNRIGEIADGGPVEDKEVAQADLLFLFPFLHLLRGGFYSAMWEVLAPAHDRLVDLLTKKEAEELLGEEHAPFLDLDARLGHIHPSEKGVDDGKWHVYDRTYLKEMGAQRYAKHEIEARKQALKRT
ncbi:MAG: hypothetical protein J2P36_04955 [Ktedonobacteraceae bacterium]|nr:hypothetical protein [Ktedonobacteraceae bacterium]